MEPTESSDDDTGETEGVRLRVRLSRSGDERWGIKWHKQLFKTSHRLVVDEIVEGSLVDRWNAQRPEELRLRYGDRLLRANRARADGLSPALASERLRAELQRERLRALFWRPGAQRGAVLVCAESAAEAALVAAAHLGARPGALEALGEARRAVGPDAGSLLAMLGPTGRADEAECAVEAEAAPEPAVEAGALAGAGAESATSPGPSPPGEEDVAHGLRAGEVPSWTYACRRCSTALFSDLNVLPHQADGPRKASRNWGHGGPDSHGEACTSVFVEPMRWMGPLEDQTGRLTCGNPACRQKLGGFSWHGLPCSCGQWQSPAFQIHCARLDCMPSGRRGPAPRPAFDA